MSARNFVEESASNPGTGNVSLLGAASGKKTFASQFADGSSPFYFISDGAQQEAGYATLVHGTPNIIQRTTPLWNSAGTAPTKLNFTGTVRIYNQIPAEKLAYVLATGGLSVGSDALSLPKWGGTAGGTANAPTVTTAPSFSTLRNGTEITFIVNATNTGAMTLNPNSIGNTAWVRANGAPYQAGVLRAGMLVTVKFDGTSFRTVEPVGGWMELQRQTASGVSAVDFTLQTSYFRKFRLELDRGRVASAGQSLALRCGTGSTPDTGGSDYTYGSLFHTNTTPGSGTNVSQSYIDISGGLPNGDTRSIIMVDIDPGDASNVFQVGAHAKVIETTTPGFRNLETFGARAANGAKDLVRLLASGGANISGTFTMTGLAA